MTNGEVRDLLLDLSITLRDLASRYELERLVSKAEFRTGYLGGKSDGLREAAENVEHLIGSVPA